MSIADIKKNAEQKMLKSIEAFKNELAKVRTGRAHPGILDQVQIDSTRLGALLQQRVAASHEEGGPRLFLRADRALEYGRVNQIMGEINAAGIRKLSLVSTSQQAAQ